MLTSRTGAFLLVSFWLASCASTPIHSLRRTTLAGRSLSMHLSAKEDVPPPAWVTHLPTAPGFHFFVGEAHRLYDKDESLQKAWASALARIGMTQFPELVSLSSETDETLKQTSFHQRFALRLEKVNWAGIREATEYGSPYIDFNPVTGDYAVFRLLRWADAEMSKAHSEIANELTYRLPVAPEETRKQEEELVSSIKAVQRLNERITHRDKLLDNVFSKIKCGTTIGDLIHILGGPDRYNPFNNTIIDKEYYWGPYKVERFGDNPAITAISRETAHDSEGLEKKTICHAISAKTLSETYP